MDDIINVRARQQAAKKPIMRVDPAELTGSVLQRLPDFMAQISRASLEPTAAAEPAGEAFELDEEAARDHVHVEMDIVAGVLEEKQPQDGSAASEGEDKDFELSIPPAGTLPTTDEIKDNAPPLIRPISSSSSEGSSGSPPSAAALDGILAAMAKNGVPNPSKRELECDGDSDSDDDEAPHSGASATSSAKKRRIIIHTPASRAARSREQSAAPESSGTSSSGTSSSDDDDDRDEGPKPSANELSHRSPSPVRRIIIHTDESRKRSRSPSPLRGLLSVPGTDGEPRPPRSRSASPFGALLEVPKQDGTPRQRSKEPEKKRAKLLIEEVE